MKNVTFRQLRVFVEVARKLSFVRAAESLHLTPPAVTMQVKELESQVGLPLFEVSNMLYGAGFVSTAQLTTVDR